ncbi:MAG TPA: DUF2293 domain-containing protein [Candidatus Dormibacteraeota bacterium]|nr:DUF2293 domain-containing protein [Candidatus Dormibacteraeota bacterium]
MGGGVRQRVFDAADRILTYGQVVEPVTVLASLGWLPWGVVQEWRQGRSAYLEARMTASAEKRVAALRALEEWARERGMRPSEAAYVTTTRERRPLRFTADGEEALERAYRTHWLSPELSEKQQERLVERQERPPDLVAISPLEEWECALCGGTGRFLLMEEPGPVCLACAEMDHLVFLPSGDATLSRRARKASKLSAVVVRFSRSRKRYERQGILVEEAALERAEAECLADEEARARARVRAAERRGVDDEAFQAQMTEAIARLFPGCPPARAQDIARHAGARGSGRVGRSAAGRALTEDAVTLAVIASVRHGDTPYDELLMGGVPRDEARDRVRGRLDAVLDRWRQRSSRPPRLYVIDGAHS